MSIDWSGTTDDEQEAARALNDAREHMRLAVDEFIDACIEDGIITEEEGDAFIFHGTLPDPVLTVVNGGATPRERRRRRYKLARAQEVHRISGLVLAMGYAYGLTDERLDALFAPVP